jgi:hypothetical protein
LRLSKAGSHREFVLEFESVTAYEQFISSAERDGSFLLQAENLPSDAVFLVRADGSPRSRKIRPLKIIREPEGCRIILFEGDRHEKPASNESPKENSARPLHEKIRSMSMTERVALAKRGDLLERRILMQENNLKIDEFLLRNPRITEGEIAWIASNPASPVQTILTIIQHKGWMRTDSIRTGVLTNPKTPVPVVVDMIPLLSAGDLIKMFRARHLREDVHAAVERQMKKRGIRVKASSD